MLSKADKTPGCRPQIAIRHGQAVMVANGGSQHSLEDDMVSPVFADFVETEILPRVEKETGVKLTPDPEGRRQFRRSDGAHHGLVPHGALPSRAVLFGHLRRSAQWPEAPHGAYEYPEHFFPNNPVKPLRIWMHVSENDIGAKTTAAERRNWVIANGYHYQFVYAKNAGHVDRNVISQTLPQALEYVWQDYPISDR